MTPVISLMIYANALTLVMLMRAERRIPVLVIGQAVTVGAYPVLLWMYWSPSVGQGTYELARMTEDIGAVVLECAAAWWVCRRRRDCDAASFLLLIVVCHTVVKLGWHWMSVNCAWPEPPADVLTIMRRAFNLAVMVAYVAVAYADPDATASGETPWQTRTLPLTFRLTR